MLKIIWFLPLALVFTQSVTAQSIFGKWKTIDDRYGIEKAVVEIYEKNGKAYGHIVQVLEKGKEEALCVKCEGENKDKPMVGIMVVYDLEKGKKGEWKNGKLFDPENAMEFKGKLWIDPDDSNKLKVRGYLAFFYRTQTWLRVTD